MAFEMEKLLEEITRDPHSEPNWDKVRAFTELVSRSPDNPRDAVALILDKMRSSKEQEAQHALTLLEGCVQSCGRDFQDVIGKFRFLNECIKMVSPKYFENRPPAVKQRILHLIQLWARNLPDQPKIRDVRNMLQRQEVEFPSNYDGITTAGKLPVGDGFLSTFESLAERPSPLESDPRKAKLLQKLLKSKDPNDLIKANKLIKKMVKEDAQRSQLSAAARRDVDSAQTQAKLLSDMLSKWSGGRLENDEVIQQLLGELKETRTKLMELANETEEGDHSLGDVLAANDDITRVLDQYNAMLSSQNRSGGSSSAPGDVALLDIDFNPNNFDAFAAGAKPPQQNNNPPPTAPPNNANGMDLLAGLSLGAPTPQAAAQPNSLLMNPSTMSMPGLAMGVPPMPMMGGMGMQPGMQPGMGVGMMPGMGMGMPGMGMPGMGMPGMGGMPGYGGVQPGMGGMGLAPPPAGMGGLGLQPPPGGLAALGLQPPPGGLGGGLGSLGGLAAPAPATNSMVSPLSSLSSPPLSQPKPAASSGGLGGLDDLLGSLSPTSNASSTPAAPAAAAAAAPGLLTPVSTAAPDLATMNVSLSDVQPGPFPPATIYDKNGLKVVFHIAKNSPHPSVTVVVVSFLNWNLGPISKLLFQAAVPKTLQVKLMPASAGECPPNAPGGTPKAVTQVMLVCNTTTTPTRIRYRLSYSWQGQNVEEMGEWGNFPAKS